MLIILSFQLLGFTNLKNRRVPMKAQLDGFLKGSNLTTFNPKRSNYIIKLQFSKKLLSPELFVIEGGNYLSYVNLRLCDIH
jgi:hypothetical protein